MRAAGGRAAWSDVAWVDADAPVGWEGLTVAREENPQVPWGTVVTDDPDSSKVEVMAWEYWKQKEPTKLVARRRLVIWHPSK